MRGVRSALLCCLVVASVLVVPSGATAAAPDATAQTDNRILVTNEHRLTPDEPGAIDVHREFDLPAEVSELTTRVPPDARNVRTDGFEALGDGRYRWQDGGYATSTPTLTFTRPANETGRRVGPEGDEGRLRFVDTGSWAVTPVNSVGFSYRFRAGAQLTVRQRNVTAGEGVAGSGLAFLGAHTVEQRRANGQQFRLVLPEAAEPAANTSAVFDSLTAASEALRVGDRDPRVLAILAPESVAWGVEGLQRGDSDFYVTGSETVSTPGNTWVHEYVHTRQRFNLTDRTRWLTEATAQYYAAKLTLDQDRVEFDRFARHLDVGADDRFAEVVLSEPSTWRSNAGNYYKGALVAGELDRQTRLATEREATFQRVFRRLNEADRRVDAPGLLADVEATGNESVAELAARYTEGTAGPAAWSVSQHDAAFGGVPASMRYGLPLSVEGFRLAGPYRNTTLGGAVRPVVGETFVVNATVENVGGGTGRYNVTLTENGTVTDSATGELGPGEGTVAPLSAPLDRAGTRAFAVGGDRRLVDVVEPATPAVDSLGVDATAVAPGETVTVTAAVSNDANRPGRRTLTVTRDGGAVANRTVHLDTGERTSVTVPVEIPGAGDHRIAVGERSVTVTASTPTETPTTTEAPTDRAPTETTGGGSPGFGALAVGVVLAALAAGGSLSNRRE
jgi:hypothetical protein